MAETLEHEELNEWGRNVLKTPGVIVSKHAAPRTDCPLLDNYSEKAIMTARLEHGGTVYGLISVSLPEGFSADGEEKNLFLEVAQDIAFALHAIDIDQDRERAAQKLREKARQIEILMKDRPEGLWVWDREADRLFFNESYEKNLGYEPGELQPSRSRWEAMIHPDDAERIQAFIESRLDDPSKGNTIEYEYRIRTKKGFWKWVTDRGHIVERNENGKAVRISGTQTGRDGSTGEVPFRESCQNLVDALCTDPWEAVILHWDSDAPEGGRIFAASKAACEVTGFTAKELIGRKPADLLTGHDEDDTSRAAIKNSEGRQIPVTMKRIHFHVLGHPAAATFLKMRPPKKERVLQNQTD
jgi:PAS domain S-box-containing protein